MEASPGRVDVSLFKSWSPGIGCGHNGGGGGLEFLQRNIHWIKKNLCHRNQSAWKAETGVKATSGRVCSNHVSGDGMGPQ